ncbi:T-lymphocyte surface antigen Ly-9-like isoform X1 [Xiphophorus couchianus]|uniref:T-lymphocyte surface antigen Ly-9-like isoform X1 n=1 Tax=Xiphophorus couchianus TaxID=32473 RepID=UPI0010167D48|nr:T-lymphocyte surface antigen Ly-9-like isoform X1 [Xiphophorus couchianus]
METQITFICLFLVILGFSAGQEEKENLTGIVGGTITLPGAVTEKGYLLYNGKNIASVFKGEFDIDVNIYKNKLQWNRSSGLFTITNLQKNDSGTYTVQKGEFSSSYKLQVYDPAPTPAVTPVNVTSDPCLLICSVDKPATLLWIRDKEIQNQSRSALSLPVTVHTEDRDSSYRCVAANPAENKTVDVNLMSSCGFKQTQTLDYRRTYWIAGGLCIGFIVLIGFGFLLIQKKFLVQKSSGSQTQAGSVREEEVQYTPIHFKDKRQNQGENIPEPSGSSDNNLTTVYAKLEPPTTDQNLLTASG